MRRGRRVAPWCLSWLRCPARLTQSVRPHYANCMIHAILVGALSLLGLTVWARITFTLGPGDREHLQALWSSSSFLMQSWLVFSFVVPAAYYIFCFLCSISVIPPRALKRSGLLMHLLALPVFIALSLRFRTMGTSALLLAFFWLMMYRER